MSEWCSEAEAFARAEIRFPGVASIGPALAYAIDAGQIAKRGGRREKRRLDFIPVLSPGQNAPGYWDDRAVEINIRDLELWMLRMAGAASPVVETIPQRPSRQRGIPPEKRNRVLAEMRVYGVEELERWSQEAMREQFKASRETCKKALAMLAAETGR
ncbi:hypothetical protein [Mesorhizobium sp. M0138]|uniref:hypothetical protein n=1 Tax=Mesorhizobium sp. M0138 TaxID=2956891 RepID=UPI00333DB2A4